MKNQKVKISWLKPHPYQCRLFPELGEDKSLELAEDLKIRGLQEPIHCCKDGTIVRGHRRTAAAKLLGWQEISAVIHNDYVNPVDPAVLTDLVQDNLMRRQLTDLDLARCYLELSKSCDSNSTGIDRRDYVASRLNLGKSGRTLERLAKLLNLPVDIQQFINLGKLTKSQGAEILKQPSKIRELIYQDLRSGKSIRSVLQQHLPLRNVSSMDNRTIQFFQRLKAILPTLKKQLPKLVKLQTGTDLVKTLDESVNLFTKLRDRRINLRRESIKNLHEILKKSAGQNDQSGKR